MKTPLVGTWAGVTSGKEPSPLAITFAADGSYVASQTLPDHASLNTTGEAVPLFDENGTNIGTQSSIYITAKTNGKPAGGIDERTREETVRGTYTVTTDRIEARLYVDGADEPTVEQLIFAIKDDTLTLHDQHGMIMTLRRVF